MDFIWSKVKEQINSKFPSKLVNNISRLLGWLINLSPQLETFLV